MDDFECIKVIGEGSYGVVMKCQHKNTGQIVAIKKFQETADKDFVEKIASRELCMLKKLRHENVIGLIHAFKENQYFHFVFEYMDGTLLEELEKKPDGLGLMKSKETIFQVLRALQFCHQNEILHRDLKPENILISTSGVVKLCDLGFARPYLPYKTQNNSAMTEYVATRWYRAPELLVCDPMYDFGVDIWALGCIFAEIMTGNPLFPGDSDIDQLYKITQINGHLCMRHKRLLSQTNLSQSAMINEKSSPKLGKYFKNWPKNAFDFLQLCLKMDPNLRSNANQLITHELFRTDNFVRRFMPTLRHKIRNELNNNILLKSKKLDFEIITSTESYLNNNGGQRRLSIDSKEMLRPISLIKLTKNEKHFQTTILEINQPTIKTKQFLTPKLPCPIENDYSDNTDLNKKIPEWLKQLENNSKMLENKHLFYDFNLL